MRLKPLFGFLLVILLVSTMLAFLQVEPVRAQATRPTKQIIYTALPREQAIVQIKTGQLHAYLFPPPVEAAQANLGSPDVSFLMAPAGINNFILNPAVPNETGVLNPFANRRIRMAVNYLVDREFIIQDIFKGFALPMYTFLSPADPDYIVVQDIVARYKFPFNPELAREIITEEMTKMGAVMGEDGYWYYNGQPVTINFIIRVEDERFKLGHLLADQLEAMGFKVNRLEMTFGPAISTVYDTDPADFQWHVYTEGWGKGALVKYADGAPAFWGAPWYGNMPGWGAAEWWNYENDTIDNITKRLFFAKFKDRDERNSLFRQATELIIKEAVRIMVVTTLDPFPYNPDILGISEDFAAGLRSIFNLREIYMPGEETLRVGHLWVYTERTRWGPIDFYFFFFFDVYSVDPWGAVHDPWIWLDPWTGLVIPFRVSFEVETAGPEGNLTIPEDAFRWDPVEKRWVTVGPGEVAVSKVTFDLSLWLGTPWHHNISISWADVLYDIYIYYEWTFAEDKIAMDFLWNYFFSDGLELIKAFRIVDGNKLEVYGDYWHFEESEIASALAPPVTAFPWEITYGIEQLVLDGSYTWNTIMQRITGIPAINLILSGHAEDLSAKLASLAATASYPENVFTLPDGTVVATIDDAVERFNTAKAWIDDKAHGVISNGPFYLENFDAAGQSLVLRAYEGPYPFPPGYWVRGLATKPQIISVTEPVVNIGSDVVMLIDTAGPTPLILFYTIRDPVTGEVIESGTAKAITARRFEIRVPGPLTIELGPGTYEVELLLASEKIAALDFAVAFFQVLSPGVLGERMAELDEELDEIRAGLEDLRLYVNATLSAGLEEIRIGLETLSVGLSDAIDRLGGTLREALVDINNVISALRDDIATTTARVDDVEGAVGEVQESLGDVNNTLQSINTLVTVLLVVMIINLIVSIIGIVRRK